MNHPYHPRRSHRWRSVLIGALAWLAIGGIAYAHGGKTHGSEPFSAFQAVQKAVQLYDRLIVSGKLPVAWETDLTAVHVTVRGAAEKREYVVEFKRSADDPPSVFFYFDRQGEYSGSNFTGN